MKARWRRADDEHLVELVVQRSRALRQGDVLCDTRKVGDLRRGVFEARGEVRGHGGDIGAEHRHQAPTQQERRYLLEVLLRRRVGSGGVKPGLLAKNCCVQLLELWSGSSPTSSRRARRRS